MFAQRPAHDITRKVRTIYISEQAHLGLQLVAAQHGYKHGGHGNISQLLEAIGTGLLEVDLPPELKNLQDIE